MQTVDPAALAKKYLQQLHDVVRTSGQHIHVVDFIASDETSSMAYVNATKKTFTSAGFEYELRQVPRLQLESKIHRRGPRTC